MFFPGNTFPLFFCGIFLKLSYFFGELFLKMPEKCRHHIVISSSFVCVRVCKIIVCCSFSIFLANHIFILWFFWCFPRKLSEDGFLPPKTPTILSVSRAKTIQMFYLSQKKPVLYAITGPSSATPR